MSMITANGKARFLADWQGK